jgi:hypothetical protein
MSEEIRPAPPLLIEQNFQNLVLSLSQTKDDRRKLDWIAEFALSLAELPADLTFSYYLDIAAPALLISGRARLDDCPPASIGTWLSLIALLDAKLGPRIERESMDRAFSNLLYYKAVNEFQIGELASGWRALRQKESGSISPAAGGLDGDDLLLQAEARARSRSASNIDAFGAFIEEVSPVRELPDAAQIYDRWLDFDRRNEAESIQVLLVDREPADEDVPHGMIVLMSIQGRDSRRTTEVPSVTIHNASPSARAELTGILSDAVAAADDAYIRKHGRDRRTARLAFSFPEKDRLYGGGSVGIGAALLAFDQKLRLNARRHHLLFRRSSAVTGNVGLKGSIEPVDVLGLRSKIEAAFFSRLRTVAVPSAQLDEARAETFRLKSRYHGRSLDVVGIQTLDEIAGHPAFVTPQAIPWPRVLARRTSAALRLGGAAAGAVATILAGWQFSQNPQWHFWKDPQPARLAVSGRLVRAFNRDAMLIWTFQAPFDLDPLPEGEFGLWDDIDQDGRPEFICPLFTSQNEIRSSRIFCFRGRGKPLWMSKIGREIRTPTRKYPDYYNATVFGILEVGRARERMVLVGATHSPWEPCVLDLLDSHGVVRGEYWNCGHLNRRTLLILDIDRDGNKEIVIGGQNNGHHAACLVILSPEAMWGSSPQEGAPGTEFLDLRPGTELAYILIPPSPPCLLFADRNLVEDIYLQSTEARLDVKTVEVLPVLGARDNACLRYLFDDKLRALSCRPETDFLNQVRLLNTLGIIGQYGPDEISAQKDRIRYWNGSRWSLEPSWNEASRRPIQP